MKKEYVFLLLCLLFFLYLPKKSVFAVTTSISSVPTSISLDEFTIGLTISGASAGINYLRIDLFKPNTTNYFGETFNTVDWYGGSDFDKYLPITIESGIDWTGAVKARVGNPNIIQYDNPGQYTMRVRRYTLSGGYNSTEANNSVVDITINAVIPTVIENQTPTPENSPTLIPETAMQETIPPASNTQPQTYDNIFISEVMINPENAGNEWVEIYNENDFIAMLDSWFIDDLDSGGTTPKKFSLNIDAKNYAVLEFTSSLFNNDQDSVRLLDSEKKEVDSFQYNKSEKGKTLGRISYDSDSFCLQNPSYGTENNSCLNPTSSPTIKSVTTSIPTLTNSPIKITTSLTPIISTKPKLFPTGFFSLVNYQVENTPTVVKNNSDVLGITVQKAPSNGSELKPVTLSLSFISFGYSSLAAFSLLYKIKKSLTL